jgi:membrane fusion protein
LRDTISQSPAVNPAESHFSLFRPQALEYVGTRQLGTVLLTRSFSHTFLTVFFVALAVAVVLFFALFSTTRKAQCQGILLPVGGVTRILPGQSGVISDRRVKEGQLVRAGDVLFVLSGERSSGSALAPQRAVSALLQHRRDSFDAELRQAEQQSRQRIAAQRQRCLDLIAEIERIDSQIELQQRRVLLAEQAQKRYAELQQTGYISLAQWQDKQAELLDQRQRIADLQRAKSASERELATARADAGDLALQAQRDASNLERNVSAMEQDLTENEARREILIRAPQDGMVTAITAEIGQTVASNAVLASLLPAGAALEAEIYVPSRSVGFVKPGMAVLLRYQAYPYQKFGQYPAQVREIANTSLRSEDLGVAAPAQASEPLYRIRLTLQRQSIQAYGRAMPLKSGMVIDASILMEQRRLYEWVLEPLFSITGRI